MTNEGEKQTLERINEVAKALGLGEYSNGYTLNTIMLEFIEHLVERSKALELVVQEGLKIPGYHLSIEVHPDKSTVLASGCEECGTPPETSALEWFGGNTGQTMFEAIKHLERKLPPPSTYDGFDGA